MKKVCKLLISVLMILTIFCVPVRAADEYEFELNYTGDIVINETKDASVILRGTNASTYAKVRIKIDITGPATPKIIAEDSLGTEIDIAQEGYWGPPEGFPVSGTFENETPVKATFTAAGTYTIKLSLVNMENSEAEITSRTFTIEVLEDTINTNEIVENNIENNEESNNEIDKLPQTGMSVTECIIYIAVIVGLIYLIYYRMRKA